MSILLSRQEFKKAVLSRNNGHCCVPDCKNQAVDAHHIVERALWDDGGYYLDNGAGLCHEHHYLAETTEIDCQDLRKWCNIENIHLPPDFNQNDVIDKWGNQILPNGQRLRGPLFQQESVQKVLHQSGQIQLFTHWVKYPKTWHLPFSPGIGEDDRKLTEDIFKDQNIVVTIKKDGENTTLYQDHIHARSLDSKHHPSRDWVKSWWNTFRWDIPKYWRIVGENLYAQHSISYDNLKSYFYGISIWNEQNICLSWEETLDWMHLFDITPIEVIYQGQWNENKIQKIAEDIVKSGEEGIVVRLENEFSYRDFSKSVAKYVRKNHVQTNEHWMHQDIKPNKLKS